MATSPWLRRRSNEPLRSSPPERHRRRRKSWHPIELSRNNRSSPPPPMPTLPSSPQTPAIPSSHAFNVPIHQRSARKDRQRAAVGQSDGSKHEVDGGNSGVFINANERRESGHNGTSRQDAQEKGVGTSMNAIEQTNPDYRIGFSEEAKEKASKAGRENERKDEQGALRRASRGVSRPPSKESEKIASVKPSILNEENLRTKQEEFSTEPKSELNRGLGDMNRTYLEGMLPESAMSEFLREDRRRSEAEKREAKKKHLAKWSGRR